MNNALSALNLGLFSIIFLVTLFLSGNAVIVVLGSRTENLPIDLRFSLAMVLGVSLPPIILLWTSTIGLRLSSNFAFMYLGLAFVVNGWALFRNGFPTLLDMQQKTFLLHDLFWLSIIFFLTWLVRFVAVYGLLVAPGSDSYHHTLIATLIAQQGKIPVSYRPFASIDSFTYHFGFHAVTAFMYWLTGLPLTKLVLWVGQGINSLIVLAIYFMTKRLTRQSLTALIAAFLVGLVAVFPAYMVNWSRFTQLTGLTIFTLVVGILLGGKKRIFLRVLPILVGGIFLSHYRVFAMFGLFLGITILVWIAQYMNLAKLVKDKLEPIFIVVVGVMLTTPWFLRILLSTQLKKYAEGVTSNSSVAVMKPYYNVNRLESAQDFYSNKALLLLAFLGVIRGWVRYRQTTLILCLWTILLLLLSNPYWLSIRGAGFVDLNSVIMSLFVSVCFFAALGVRQLLPEKISSLTVVFVNLPRQRLLSWSIVMASLVWLIMVPMFQIVVPENVYVRANDNKAMEWINENTNDEDVFFTNFSFFSWGGIVGSDAGYWIPLLAHRQTTIMPMLAWNEGVKQPAAQQVLVSQLTKDVSISYLMPIFKSLGVTYVFFGEKGGVLSPAIFADTDCAQKTWELGSTKIFALNYDCGQ